MPIKFRSVLVFSIFMITAVMLSACTQSLSSAPVETPTLIPTGLFVSPVASVENPMEMIEQFAKQTEAAQTAAAGGGTPAAPTSGTPQAETATNTPGVDVATATLTPAANIATPTNSNSAAATPVAAATSVPPGSRPATYTLQVGEFPYCIARRFNVDPDALLQASGLTAAQANNLSAGTVLTIPQGAGGFPGSRALRAHPATYTVASGDETMYSIACLYGDVDPNAIASANGIAVSAKLTLGQTLNIP
jgi:LysM repeat protein